jgi:hypothetical protein
MENYLYLLELFVETINFSSNIPHHPKANEIVVSGEIGKFMKLDVFTVQSSPGRSNSKEAEA